VQGGYAGWVLTAAVAPMPGAPVEVLQRVPLFADLNRREVEQIARLFKERRFSDGDTVTKEGSGGAAFFLIDSGEATVSVGGKERTTLEPGDYFGEISLIDEGARSATITASSELVCWGLTFWEFRPLVQENPAIGWKLLQSVVKKLRVAEQG
jgi:CRP/FNR family cyclic AMP-dependent transcriptional regulator